MEITIQKSNQLKAIAILMMLCLHLFNKNYIGLFQPLIFIGNQPLSYYISLFSDVCVPVFCFISGYGLYYKFQKSETNYNKENTKRIKKLYVNYWVILFLFAVLLGFLLNKEGYPSTVVTFLLNLTALDSTYNGAWWFFFTYVLLVLSSSGLFYCVNKIPTQVLLSGGILFYVVTFYFRVYQPNLFDNELLNWLQRQLCLYGTSLLPFMIGSIALKEKWNTKITQIFNQFRYKNLLAISGIVALVVIHGIVPNFIIAPFLAVPFLFLFVQIKLPVLINKTLDYLAHHATNMWLIHMFFYMIYFEEFIYSPKYVLPIFLLLVSCCLLSSIVVNAISQLVLNKIKL